MKQSKSNKQFIVVVIYALILLLALSAAGYFFVRYTQVNKKYSAIPDIKNQQTLASVGKIIDLPKDETPSLYEVKDKDKLATTQAAKDFFDKAANGDVIIVYQKANVAVIYRPKDNKVIKTDTAEKLSEVKVAVIAPSDLQQKTVEQLQAQFSNINIISKDTPKVSESGSYVVDATGANAQAAQAFASKLGLSVGQLPDGETKPEGAALIVVIANPATQ